MGWGYPRSTGEPWKGFVQEMLTRWVFEGFFFQLICTLSLTARLEKSGFSRNPLLLWGPAKGRGGAQVAWGQPRQTGSFGPGLGSHLRSPPLGRGSGGRTLLSSPIAKIHPSSSLGPQNPVPGGAPHSTHLSAPLGSPAKLLVERRGMQKTRHSAVQDTLLFVCVPT